MPWFYNSYSGEAVKESGPAATLYYAALHTGTGWHEYATKNAMLAAVKAHGWPAPTSSIIQGVDNAVTGTITSAVTSAIEGAFQGLGHFTVGVTGTTGLLGRVLKVVFGGVLITAGIMRFTGAGRDLFQIAGATVRKAA